MNIRAVISFLTIIPTKPYDLNIVADNMHLFPIVGLLIGLVGLISFLPINNMIISFLIVIALFIITGSHHTDALADFADGLMVKGDKERKRSIMHSPTIGATGASAIIIYFIGMIISLSLLNGIILFIIVIISEVLAKYSMVLLAYKGKAAWDGIGKLFMPLDRNKFLFSSIITIIISLLGGVYGILAFIISILSTYIILLISNRSFGGISGDVFGASNEIIRLIITIFFAIINIDKVSIFFVYESINNGWW
jgi:adenosylcobinamide-GDP ribazoletransferase